MSQPTPSAEVARTPGALRKPLLIATLIILLALALRLYGLGQVPPGLTHDEANHGREAIGILDGDLRYYFPLNYGSEPLYSYTVAASMALLGENVLALRLVNVLFGVAALALTAVWARRAFDLPTALLGAALTAVSFWPIASSREALRAGMLPFFMALAVLIYWEIVYPQRGPPARRRRLLLVAGFALALVALFHIYLAARVAWLLFPLFLLYLAVWHRPDFARSWRPVTAGLLLAGLLLIPMFVYLANNPAAQTRLSMLDGTLGQALSGDISPVLQNMGAALLAFIWPGYGDQFLAYNIPGRPVLDALTAVFFLAGLFFALWRWRQPAYAFLLLWFVTGIIPSLITGPTANTTRNLAALPAVYLLAAAGFAGLARLLGAQRGTAVRPALITIVAFWLLFAGVSSARAYFVTWGQSAAVRGAYQQALAAELAYIEQQQLADRPLVLSSVYPGPVHDASIALVLAGEEAEHWRWVDARRGLVQPPATATALISAATPPHPAFAPLLRERETVALRADDLDPFFKVYDLAAPTAEMERPLAEFGGALALLEARWLAPQTAPGGTAELLTRWRVSDPLLVGPRHFPAETTEAMLFTHVLAADGRILVQQDALDAPSWAWQAGDIVWQVHNLPVPVDTAPGNYATQVGVYDRPSGARLPLLGAGTATGETAVSVTPLKVANSRD